MKVVGFAAYSGAGKTTLVEQVVALLKGRGLRVSVIKHAHHEFDIDRPGKDSWRHRQAGAYEVLIASSRRLALMRELDQPGAWQLEDLLDQLDPSVDWVLVEGFKQGALPKIEVWRAEASGESPRPVLYPQDACIRAIATDDPDRLPEPTLLPVLDLNDAAAVVAFLVDNSSDFNHRPIGQAQRPGPATCPTP